VIARGIRRTKAAKPTVMKTGRAGSRWPGRRFLYEPQARVEHKVPGDRGRWSYFRARCYGEGLSKAAVSRLAGATRGLESERAYVRRTLPRGVVRGLKDGFGADRPGLRRVTTRKTSKPRSE